MRLYSTLVVLCCTLLTSSNVFAQTCPAPMETARRLLLVTVPTLTSPAGKLRLFARRQPDAAWDRIGSAEPVTVGIKGVAWSRAFRDLAGDGEPVKIEGDNRSPAGIYTVGRPFGFAPSPLANYLRINSDSVCVEDPSSPAYNTITSRRAIGRLASRENMRASGLYRRGLFVDYPTDGANRAGSCIFIHILKLPAKGTAGCVTLPENRVAALQRFANKHPTVLVLLPESALSRLEGCLPVAIAGPR
jgi:L,D-peptidoglycan transpeptidase YkuD (ErfK/YbiS/YcfS/YnhG family)